ncbi:family 20 glycosylhydrolase [Gelidibacter sp. F2691]|nr:family 20 glycosylhydrolase [Gelidibacter sp. F2691]
MKNLTVILTLFLIWNLSVQGQNSLPVVPSPQQWHPNGKVISYKKVSIKWNANADNETQIVLNRFKQELQTLGVQLVESETKQSLHLNFDTNYAPIGDHKTVYQIDFKKHTEVKASSFEGLVHATRTLLQLFSQDAYKTQLPEGTLIDFPKYEKRMLMIDVARKFFTVDELKDFIRIMAWVKMNELHLHLSDNSWGGYSAYRLESAKYPELTAKDGHYSWEEIQDLQDFAYSFGITITPEIDSPGHSLAFTNIRPDLKSPWLSANYLDITNKDTYTFMEEILTEIIPHFSAPDFHLGTDEYRINSIKDDSLKHHIGDTFRKYINHFNKVVKAQGKNTRIWSGFENMPGDTKIDKDVIIDMWETSDAKDKSEQGYEMINSSHYYTYIVPGAPYYGVNNKFIYEAWTPEIFSDEKSQNLTNQSKGLLGSKLHIWNDLGPTGYSISEIARLVVPSIYVFSEKMWGTKAHATLDQFNSQLAALGKIPHITILDRTYAKEQTVLSKKNLAFRTTSHVATDNQLNTIEYPWSLEMTLNRTGASSGQEVLLSSKLATVYADLSHEFKDGKTTVTKTGIAIVRANQTEGKSPLTSHHPDVIVFDHSLAIGKDTKVKIIGEKNKTSLYIDGALIGSQNIQMVCPIEFIGSPSEPVFQGVLKDITVKQL